MSYPSEEDVAALHGKSPEWYANWLRVGLAEYQLERKGALAFPGVENFVDQREGRIASDLELVFLALRESDRHAFRRGVADLLQGLNFADPREAAVAVSVLEVGAAIGARGLLRILATKSFSLSGEQGARLYDLAFDTSTYRPDIEPKDTILCLKYLIGHELFLGITTGRALIALTQAKQDEFPSHFQFLNGNLESEYGYVFENDDQERKRARARKRLVENLASLLLNKALLIRTPREGDRLPIWWLDAVAAHAPEAWADHGAPPSAISDAAILANAETALNRAGRRDVDVADARQAIEGFLFGMIERDGRAARRKSKKPLVIAWSGTGLEELVAGMGDLGDTKAERPTDCAGRQYYENAGDGHARLGRDG